MSADDAKRRSRRLPWRITLAVCFGWVAALYADRPHPNISSTEIIGPTTIHAGDAVRVLMHDNIPDWCIGTTKRYIDYGPDKPTGYLPSDPMPDNRINPIPVLRSNPVGCGTIVIQRSMFGCGLGGLLSWYPVTSKPVTICVASPGN